MLARVLALMPSSLAAGLISAVCCAVLLRLRAQLPLDAPNARSLHRQPVPRVGGLAIWTGFVPVATWWTHLPGDVFTWTAWAALLVVSLFDDYRGLPAAARLCVHAAAGLLAAWGVAHQEVNGAALLLLAVAIAWSANLYNFMDGSDGLAALMTITGFGAYAAAAGIAHFGASYAALAFATVPFAIVNAPPARMFMGDAGAVPLGFLAATCGAAGWIEGAWPAWFPLLVFLPFLADSTVTLARRAARGERVWEAHREHYYQRLNRLGAGHLGTLVIYGVLMLGSAISAVLAVAIEPQAGWAVLIVWCALLAMMFGGIDYHWARRRSS